MLRNTKFQDLVAVASRFLDTHDLNTKLAAQPALIPIEPNDSKNMTRELRRRRTRKLAGHAGQTVKTTWY